MSSVEMATPEPQQGPPPGSFAADLLRAKAPKPPASDDTYKIVSFTPPGAAPASPHDPIIAKYSTQFGVDPSYVRAIMLKGERSHAPGGSGTSPAGAQGVMQLMPSIQKHYGVTDPMDPDQNIKAGVQLIKSLLVKYKGDERLAAAAYNAGEPAVDKYGDVPPFKETQAYVPRVMEGRGGAALDPGSTPDESPPPKPRSAPPKLPSRQKRSSR